VRGEVSFSFLGPVCALVYLTLHTGDGESGGTVEGLRTLAQETFWSGFRCEDLQGDFGFSEGLFVFPRKVLREDEGALVALFGRSRLTL
jgi:hypothetical protein